MRKSAALYGILGLDLLVFGLIDYFVAAGFQLFVVVNLVGAIIALIAWVAKSGSNLTAIAGSRTTKYGANAIVYSAGFIGLLVAINYLSTLHHQRFDMTAKKVYSLSSQSKKVIKGLKTPLKFYGFFAGGVNPAARELYEMYQYQSPKVSFQMVNPDRDPELAERFKVSVMGTTHIQYGGGEGTNVTKLTEEALTNGIIRVAKSANQVIYFLDGHGEADVSDNATDDGFGMLKKSLEGEGYTVKKLLLATEAKVPGDASEVIVAGPKKQLLPHEIDALNDYLKTGGRMLIMFRPPAPDQPIDESALAKLAADWGVKAGADVVVDQVVRLFAGPALGLTPMVDTYEGDSPITRGFKQRTVFPMVRSLTTAPDLKTGLAVIPIAKTSDTSWAETDLEGVFRHGQAKFSGNDLKGPIDVVDEVQGDLERMGMGKGEARLVMFGSTEFADNKYLNDFYNRDFFMNSADWLAGEANSISIRPRMIRASRFRLTVSDFEIVFALSVLLLPEMLSLLGIIVWWERRN